MEVRQSVNSVIANATVKNARLINQIVRESISGFIGHDTAMKKSTITEDNLIQRIQHARLAGLLLNAVSFADGMEESVQEDAVVELIVLAHHPLIGSYSLCRK